MYIYSADNASQAPYGIEENSKSATFWLLVAIIILLSLSVLFLLSYVVYTKRSNEMSEKKNHCKSSTPKGELKSRLYSLLSRSAF